MDEISKSGRKKIITIYKNKGLMSDGNNYRGISLLGIIGKAFARVALKRLQRIAEEVYYYYFYYYYHYIIIVI